MTHTTTQKRCRRNEIFVNTLKMESGCSCCEFRPMNEAECRLLDLNHRGGGRIGQWAEKSAGKTADVARLVWSGAALARILEEIGKGDWMCKNCHAMAHVDPPARIQETEDWAVGEVESFLIADKAPQTPEERCRKLACLWVDHESQILKI